MQPRAARGGRVQTSALRSSHRAWRWLLAVLIGLALLQPSFGFQVDAEPAHCSDMAAGGDGGHGAGSACGDAGCLPGGCAGACAAVAVGDVRLPLATARSAAPPHAPPVAIDRAVAPETPPPIG
jgi:hypothetical protein